MAEATKYYKLARGMTVQSDNSKHYAFCVRCRWESPRQGYTVARRIARQPCPICNPENSMKLTQEVAYTYHQKNGFEPNVLHQALNVVEEAGEVARAVLKRAQGIRGTHEHWSAELQKEVGDVVISLMCLAAIEGFDLGEAVDKRWDAVISRDMAKHAHQEA